MPLDDLAADVQAQAHARDLAGQGVGCPAKWTEDAFYHGWRQANALVLHLVARNLTRKGDDFVPVKSRLGENRSGSWGAYAAENWIVLDEGEWRQLLPQGPGTVGSSWDINPGVAGKVVTYFYPATENNDARMLVTVRK